MQEKYCIGVDSGSQSTKIYIINQRGEVVCSAVQPLRPVIARQPGWVEHPDDDLWESLKTALQRLFEAFEGNKEDILGMGLCAIRCCRVFLKSDGLLAAPVMSWMDVRAYEPFQDEPGIAYTGSTSGYLTFRLTGELKDTIANAYQQQFPTDMERWTWSEDPKRYNACGIPREKLLDIHLPGKILGYVTAEAAAETGLPQGLPVVSTANDKAVEALGSGLIDLRAGLLSLGTYITSMVMGMEYRPAAENYFTNLSSVPYRYLYESSGIRGGMWHISWFKELIGDEFAGKAEAYGLSAEELLEQEASLVSVGSDGLMIMPDWLAPSEELFKKGVMIGFNQQHTRGHIYRALMEAIAMRMKNFFDAMTREIGMVPEKLIVCGGGSNSKLFMQIVADVFGIRAVRNVVNGAAALGSAVSAAVATGLYRDYEEAVSAMVHEQDVFFPDNTHKEVYARLNESAYSKLPHMLEDTLKTMHDAYR